MKLADIIPHPLNPRTIRKHEAAKLKKSIESFGMVEPLIFNTKTKHLVSGHQRLKVMQELGITETDVVIIEETEANEQTLMLGLNQIKGSWDYPKLGAIFEELKIQDSELIPLTGFEKMEILHLTGAQFIPTPVQDEPQKDAPRTKHSVTCPKCKKSFEP